MNDYQETIWKDRLVQYPNRYQDQNGNILELTALPGEIAEEGTSVNEANLNNMEKGIKLNNISTNSILKALGLNENTYSSSSKYNVDDLVIYNYAIYQCKTAVTIAEEFDSSKWELVPFFVNE